MLHGKKHMQLGASALYTQLTFLYTHAHLEINSVVRTHAYGNKQSHALLENASMQELTCKPQGPQHLEMDTTHVQD